MITKQDVIILLTDLQEQGIDVSKQLNDTLKNGVSIPTIQFINANRQLPNEPSRFI